MVSDDVPPESDDDPGADLGDGAGSPQEPIRLTGWQRLQQTFYSSPANKPAAEAPDYSELTDAEIKARVTKIDATERRVGYAASAIALAFALVYTVPYLVSKIAVPGPTKPHHKICPAHFTYTTNGKTPATCNRIYPASHYVTPLVVWLVLAAAIFIAVRVGRRSLLAFAILITGLSFGTFLIFLPFLAAGGWLLLRAYRTQRFGSPTAKQPVPGYTPSGPRARGQPRAAPAKGSGTKQKPAPQAKPQLDKGPPTANKRYTPKTPPKKKPPAS